MAKNLPLWAERLRAERRNRTWSQSDMAKELVQAADERLRAHLPERESIVRRIRDYEAGKHQPRDPCRVLYCRVFDLDEDDLFGTTSPAGSIALKAGTSQAGSPGPNSPNPRNEGDDPTKRRTALKLGVSAVLAPETLGRVLAHAAAEAMEFTRMACTAGVGSGTFDHLEAVVMNLGRSYSREPPASLFALAHTYRAQVARLIQGPHTLREGRELYVYAAWLSESLAWLAHDLGDPLTAEAYAIDSYEHADQAGHAELCTWAMDAMSSIHMYANRPDRAVFAALKGVMKAPNGHPLAVRLRAQAARAHARLGNRDDCTAMLQDADQLYGRLPSRTPARFTVDTGTLAGYAMTAYSASSYIWLEDYEAARKNAEAAIAVHEEAPAHSASPSRKAIARIDLGIALAHLGDPDQAVELGDRALTSSRAVDSVRNRVGDLQAVLVSRYPDVVEVRNFHERYQQLKRSAAVGGEGA